MTTQHSPAPWTRGNSATDADAERFADTLPPVVRETKWGKHPQLGGFCYWREYDRQGTEIRPFFIDMEPERYRAGGQPYKVCESGAGRSGGAEQRGAFSKLRAAQKFASEANAERNGYLVRKDTL
jgi:hypothetical protein